MAAKAVILTGGSSKGTRFRPLSLDAPKALFPIAGRAIIWHGIQALSRLEGLEEVILIGFYEDSVFTGFIKETSRDFPHLKIRYLREFQSLGTAGGLYHFRDAILKGNPTQIYVLHSDIACSFPLLELKKFHDRHRGVGTIMGVRVAKESATKYGCIVVDQRDNPGQAKHYVEKPENFISDIINGGVYLFDRSIFDELKAAMDIKVSRAADDPLQTLNPEELRLEQDVIAPLVANKKLWVYCSPATAWRQIKTAGSAVPANSLVLASYKSTNPQLLRRRSPTVAGNTPDVHNDPARIRCEIIEPSFIDETAIVDPSAKIGPNVSIGAGVKVGFGCRIKESIILDNATLDKNSCVLYSIVSENCQIGAWARIEGSPLVLNDEGKEKQTITILGKEVIVTKEVLVRSCIVLPHKTLAKSFANEVLL